MRLALAVSVATETRLSADAKRHGHEVVARCSSAAELASLLASVRPNAAIVDADAAHLDAALVARADDAGVSIVALVADDAGRRLAAGLGLYETLDARAAWPDIEKLLSGSRAEPPVTQVPLIPVAPVIPQRGTIISVWGPAGAPGRTTLAISIAAELAALGHSVALADADTHGASVAPMLGMPDEAPGFAAACRLAATDSLTNSELQRISHRYESPGGGFWVLTGIGSPSRWPELSEERVAGALERCRDWVEFTVVDCGASLENDEEISSDLLAPRRNAATVTALRSADRIIAVASADPVGLARFLRCWTDVSETAPDAKVTVVANRVRASAIGMNPSGQVAHTLSRFGGIDHAVQVPHDLAAFDAAVLSGRTVLDSSPRSPARAAIRDLVQQLAPQPTVTKSRRGRSR